MSRDLNWYRPDDILFKVDRAPTAYSLETRAQLDRRVVEFALGYQPPGEGIFQIAKITYGATGNSKMSSIAGQRMQYKPCITKLVRVNV